MNGPSRNIFRVALIGIVLLCAGALIAFKYSTPQIRVDCGDIRYAFLGIPMRYEHTASPRRELLLSLAKDAAIKPQWVAVAPQTTSNCNVCTYEDYYAALANWAAQDRRLAALLLQEVSTRILDANGRTLAGGGPVLLGGVFDGPGPDWEMTPEVRDFGRAHGYIRNAWLKDAQHEKAFEAYQVAANYEVSPEAREEAYRQLGPQQQSWILSRILAEIPDPGILINDDDIQRLANTLHILTDLGDTTTADDLSNLLQQRQKLPRKIKQPIAAAIDDIRSRHPTTIK